MRRYIRNRSRRIRESRRCKRLSSRAFLKESTTIPVTTAIINFENLYPKNDDIYYSTDWWSTGREIEDIFEDGFLSALDHAYIDCPVDDMCIENDGGEDSYEVTIYFDCDFGKDKDTLEDILYNAACKLTNKVIPILGIDDHSSDDVMITVSTFDEGKVII